MFVHVVSAPVIKWVSRARAGALATSARKAKSHPTDDDSHVVAGCSSTGAADCGEVASRMWMQAAGKRGAHVTPLPASWVTAHLVQLAVALPVKLRPRGIQSSNPLTSLRTLFPALISTIHFPSRPRTRTASAKPSSGV